MPESPEGPQPRPAARDNHCPRCGAAFHCGGSGCWCMAVELPETQRNRLREKYTGCLCQKCLRELANRPAKSGSLSD